MGESCNSLPISQRLKVGSVGQARIITCLSKHHGREYLEATQEEDMYKKIDCYRLLPDGTLIPAQVKFRQSGSDIEFCYRDPWWPNHEAKWYDPEDLDIDIWPGRNKFGRDIVGEYKEYICGSTDGFIYILCGQLLKSRVESGVKEWRESGERIYAGNPFRSKLYPGFQIRWVWDKSSHHPKILVYVPPSCFNPSEIEKYKFVE